MQIEHDLTGDAEGCIRVSGEVTMAGLRAGIAALIADPAFDGDEPLIWDLREAEFPSADSAGGEAREIIGTTLAPHMAAPVAVVVNTMWDAQTSAAVYWLFCALPTAELFDDWDQGCQWLLASVARRVAP